MNCAPALAYHFCLNLPAAFTQPGARLLVEPCTMTRGWVSRSHNVTLSRFSRKTMDVVLKPRRQEGSCKSDKTSARLGEGNIGSLNDETPMPCYLTHITWNYHAAGEHFRIRILSVGATYGDKYLYIPWLYLILSYTLLPCRSYWSWFIAWLITWTHVAFLGLVQSFYRLPDSI